jgi:Na+(H+)/acetate symporter ActP
VDAKLGSGSVWRPRGCRPRRLSQRGQKIFIALDALAAQIAKRFVLILRAGALAAVLAFAAGLVSRA